MNSGPNLTTVRPWSSLAPIELTTTISSIKQQRQEGGKEEEEEEEQGEQEGEEEEEERKGGEVRRRHPSPPCGPQPGRPTHLMTPRSFSISVSTHSCARMALSSLFEPGGGRP